MGEVISKTMKSPCIIVILFGLAFWLLKANASTLNMQRFELQ